MRIVLAPGAGVAEQALGLLAEWSRSGLLEPFCVWRTEDAAKGEVPMVTVVDAGETRERSLGDALEGKQPESNALVAFYPETSDRAFDAAFTDACETMMGRAQFVMAVTPGRDPRPVIVVVPGGVGQTVPRRLLGNAWAACVYVAPEDRRTVDGPNRLTTDRLPGHAAHALATVAGLWATKVDDEGPSVFEQVLETQRRYGDPMVQIVRCFSRAVDFGYLPDHLSARVFKVGGRWPNPNHRRFALESDASTVMPYLAKDFLAKHRSALAVTPYDPLPREEPRKIGILEALRLLVTEFIVALKRKPVDWMEDRAEKAWNRVARLIENTSAKTGGGAGARWRIVGWDEQAEGERSLANLPAQIDRPLIVQHGSVAPVWTDLIRMTLGIVDGSALPEGVDVSVLQRDDKQALVTEPAALGPDPSERPTVLGDVRACDPLHIDPKFATLRTFHGEPPLAPDPALPNAAWTADHGRSLLWRVGDGIARGLAEARAAAAPPPEPEPAAAAAGESLVPAPPAPAAPKDTFRRDLRRRVRWSVLGAVLLAVGASVAAFVLLSTILYAAVQALVAMALVGTLAKIAFSAILRSRAHQEAEHEKLLAAVDEVLKKRLREGDEIRLAARYEEFRDWAETLSHIVHRAWVGEPFDANRLPPPLRPDDLPVAFEVRPGDVERNLDVLASQTRSQLFTLGWLSDLFESVWKPVMDELTLERGYVTEDQLDAERENPTADKSTDADGPRRRLVRAARNGDYRGVHSSPLSRRLLDHVDKQPLDALSEAVLDVDEHGNTVQPLPPSIAWLTPPSDLAELANRLRPSVVRVDATAGSRRTSGSGVIVAPGVIATARHVIDRAASVSVTFVDGTVVEAMVDRVAGDTDLAVVKVPEAATGPPLAFFDGELRQGDGLVSMGHPLRQEGDPTLSWGIVTAPQRTIRLNRSPSGLGEFGVFQATFPAVGGASGSPVCTLEGELLGIVTAASVEIEEDRANDYLTSVVPVAELRKLLAGEAVTPAAGEAAGDTQHAPEPADELAPSEYLGELLRYAGPALMQPRYWEGLNQAHNIESVHPDPAAVGPLDGPCGSLASASEYFHPIRVLVHRVEFAEPTPLSGVAGVPTDDPGL